MMIVYYCQWIIAICLLNICFIDGHNDHMWVKYRNKDFMLVHQEMTWMEAQSVCYSLGGFLATVSNSDEMKFIKSMTNIYPNKIWLGGTDMFAEGRWVWIENLEPISYNHWYMGSHQPAGASAENCLIWHNSNGYFWHDVTCKSNYKFVCQRYTKRKEQ
ncbi:perlucin-like protein isoform X2 [Mytilus californianus]|uniref:perlucin-like protein isoform X2 n=1 Tax=Mytilus californianus TaxID=6549 RepID=UPI00224838D0|nr:perlucin-like protein isoform X2 [Mytilus californianus]